MFQKKHVSTVRDVTSVVEMRGIEPRSTAVILRLLRAYPVEFVLLGPELCYRHLARRAQPECKSLRALRRNAEAISLNVARTRVESIPGLTVSI